MASLSIPLGRFSLSLSLSSFSPLSFSRLSLLSLLLASSVPTRAEEQRLSFRRTRLSLASALAMGRGRLGRRTGALTRIQEEVGNRFGSARGGESVWPASSEAASTDLNPAGGPWRLCAQAIGGDRIVRARLELHQHQQPPETMQGEKWIPSVDAGIKGLRVAVDGIAARVTILESKPSVTPSPATPPPMGHHVEDTYRVRPRPPLEANPGQG